MTSRTDRLGRGAAGVRPRRRGELPALTIHPFDDDPGRALRVIAARRIAGEALAFAGLVVFLAACGLALVGFGERGPDGGIPPLAIEETLP